MKNKNNFKGEFWKKGFTLIELLVVVLIIGILAAVAVPQYNKAVKKAQGREVYVAIKALDKALADYYLMCGEYLNGCHKGIFANYGQGAREGLSLFSVQIPALKYFSYGTGGLAQPSQTFKGCDNVTVTTCDVCFYLSGKQQFCVKWDKGIRAKTLRIFGDPGKTVCQYLDGAIEQVQTPSSTQTHCVVQF